MWSLATESLRFAQVPSLFLFFFPFGSAHAVGAMRAAAFWVTILVLVGLFAGGQAATWADVGGGASDGNATAPTPADAPAAAPPVRTTTTPTTAGPVDDDGNVLRVPPPAVTTTHPLAKDSIGHRGGRADAVGTPPPTAAAAAATAAGGAEPAPAPPPLLAASPAPAPAPTPAPAVTPGPAAV